ncbi:unnamed protein product [Adineta ricciae]|uniref:Transmembrane protein 230 n=1 Tax=Adineta ricciae TaxID=249248 RepID=A0A813UEI7_ADIRI|nr:unnamed protein product [Adineta ricciae]
MYIRPVRTQTLSPSKLEVEQKTDEQYSNSKDKKKKRFKSPMRNIFKPKTDENSKEPYYRLQELEPQYSDLQFREAAPKAPIYAIGLATALFLLGSLMITLGSLMLTGYIKTQYSDRTWPLIVVGSLVFLPGFYHLRIAYWAWKGDKNFSFADIPDLDWF